MSRPVDAECPNLRVWPSADVPAIFRVLDDEVVDFDVDLWELQGRNDSMCCAAFSGRSGGVWASRC